MLNTFNLDFSHYWLPLGVQKTFKTWGLVYVDVCVAFKVEVMTLPILGGLFQVYIGALRILKI